MGRPKTRLPDVRSYRPAPTANRAGVGPRRGRERARSRTTFVELEATPMSAGLASSGAIVAMTGPQGQRLTVRLRGGRARGGRADSRGGCASTRRFEPPNASIAGSSGLAVEHE